MNTVTTEDFISMHDIMKENPSQHNAFVTGSRVYGTPTADSDIDLVVLLSGSDHQLLRKLADSGDGSTGDSLRFGKLNLLFMCSDDFHSWKEATEALISMKPVTREKAIEVIEEYKKRRAEAAA